MRGRTDCLAEQRVLLLSMRPLVSAPRVEDLAAEGDGAVHADVSDGGSLDKVPRRVGALRLHSLQTNHICFKLLNSFYGRLTA